MKTTIVSGAVMAGLMGLAGAAQADSSNVTLYGLLDTTVRYSTNESASGGSKLQETDGVLTGSRLGFKGTEDLGGGLKTNFIIEAGFAPDTGVSLQGGRLFGRQAFVGLADGWGSFNLGRQYTVMHEMIASYESMALANLGIVGYQGAQYTGGVRADNMLKYSGTFGPMTAALSYAPGEVAGDNTKNMREEGSLAYAQGPLRVGGAYAVVNTQATYFGNAVSASKQKTWTLGGTYDFTVAKLYLGYTNNELDVADYKNKAVYAGFNVPVAGSSAIIGTVTSDKLEHAGTSGRRLSTGLMYDVNLSTRTDVYAEVDYTKLKDAWMTVATTTTFSTPFFAGHDTRSGLMVGLRHKF